VTNVVLVELIIALLGGVASIVLYSRSQWRSPVGRLVMAWMVVGTAEVASLLSLAIWSLSAWVFALVFGALDVIVMWRLVLLWQTQRKG
jgi:hypothetical protein